MQTDLDEALETIVQLSSELHETRVIDDRVGSPLSGALDFSIIMTFSDMKAKPTYVPVVPQHKVSEPAPESPESTVPHNVDHEKEHNLGVQIKEGMMEKYRMAGGHGSIRYNV